MSLTIVIPKRMLKTFHKMTFKITLSISLLLFFCSAISAQEIIGKVVDQQGHPIPYVNIYSDQLNAGMVSDIEGQFTFNLNSFNQQSRLIFSCIGFEEKVIPITIIDISNPIFEITLSSISYDIAAIEVKAKAIKYKKKKTGIKAKIPMIENGFYVTSNEIGAEFGVVMKNDKTCFIEKIGMNVTEVTHDTMFYELNIYDFKNKKPQHPIIQKRIFLSFLKSDIHQPIEIDFSDRNIKVSSDFFVSVEAVRIPPDCEEYGTAFVGSFKGKKTLYKNIKGKWKKNRIGVAIYTQLKCAK